MKKIILTSFWLLLSIVSYAQITTYFYGHDKIQSKDRTAALYSVSIYENITKVTVELIPTKNLKRMKFWTSKNTFIKVSHNIALPFIGYEITINGETKIDTSSNYGWDDVRKDNKYYYTMVFAGKIPPGITNFTLVDKGVYDGAPHGYEFNNYALNNPPKDVFIWSENTIKQNIDSNNDGICGIYEGSDDTGYKLGCVKQNGDYFLIYLGSREKMSWWQVGDTKAFLRKSATTDLFKANWIMKNKTMEPNSYIVFDGVSMKTEIDNQETFYLKMYPTSSSSRGINSPERWSGTGFALDNGFIATNNHVVENAKSIIVQGIKGSFGAKYNATVIATDKFNDLAIIKINDNKFNGFDTIPYGIKTPTSDVGEDVFVLGYPLTSTMGEEIKLTTGVISSKTGFQGDVSMYQITAPIQPGNSGGPLFDSDGNIIGIVSAKHSGAENVGYAIKTSYLLNLVETAIPSNIFPKSNTISTLSLSGKVKAVKDYVFYITCTNSEVNTSNNSDSSSENFNQSHSMPKVPSPNKSNKTDKNYDTDCTVNPDVNHPQMIDLGLPSGTKWASCNIGASKPEEDGGYFAWGETEEKKSYNWSNYKHCDGSMNTCHNIGFDIAGTEYDVAHLMWGGSWSIPSVEQIKELINYCKREWTTQNGVNGILVTGPNGNSFFLPATGYRKGYNFFDKETHGGYWTSSINRDRKIVAYGFNFFPNNWNWSDNGLFIGRTIRPVSK